MNVNHFDISKTGMLFFDLLNSFIHGGDEDAQARKMPMVKNAVRLMRASRAAAMPIFFAKANHRSDGVHGLESDYGHRHEVKTMAQRDGRLAQAERG